MPKLEFDASLIVVTYEMSAGSSASAAATAAIRRTRDPGVEPRPGAAMRARSTRVAAVDAIADTLRATSPARVLCCGRLRVCTLRAFSPDVSRHQRWPAGGCGILVASPLRPTGAPSRVSLTGGSRSTL